MKDYKWTFNIKNRVMAASCFNFAMAVKNFGMLNSQGAKAPSNQLNSGIGGDWISIQVSEDVSTVQIVALYLAY